MLFFRKKVKRKSLLKIEVIDNVIEKYLIMRSYKNTSYNDFIVCSNYDFDSNTFPIGKVIDNIVQAYQVFNNYVNINKFELDNSEIYDNNSGD